MEDRIKYRFADFTENKYRQLIASTKQKFTFISYGDIPAAGSTCLWRHDVDTSPWRALRLAHIENEIGVSASYFFLLHSDRYNLLDEETANMVRSIQELGHHIGLHFSPAFYGEKIRTKADLEKYLRLEREFMQATFDLHINVFSFHNPSLMDFDYSQETIAGMINTYARSIQQKYTYISDSFCIWRFKTLEEVLADDTVKDLQVLLHPVCWSEEEKSPFARFKDAVDRRRDQTLDHYLKVANKIGRKVIK